MVELSIPDYAIAALKKFKIPTPAKLEYALHPYEHLVYTQGLQLAPPPSNALELGKDGKTNT
eukprot:15328600-Ditylum_brightwellii.AAC.1